MYACLHVCLPACVPVGMPLLLDVSTQLTWLLLPLWRMLLWLVQG
jgi:hypothetical protein